MRHRCYPVTRLCQTDGEREETSMNLPLLVKQGTVSVIRSDAEYIATNTLLFMASENDPCSTALVPQIPQRMRVHKKANGLSMISY